MVLEWFGQYNGESARVSFHEAGGDFADGAIAYEGKLLGGETFVSFDRKAVALFMAKGSSAELLS